MLIANYGRKLCLVNDAMVQQVAIHDVVLINDSPLTVVSFTFTVTQHATNFNRMSLCDDDGVDDRVWWSNGDRMTTKEFEASCLAAVKRAEAEARAAQARADDSEARAATAMRDAMAQLAAGRGGEVSSATERQLAAALARVSELEAEVRSLREAVLAAQRVGTRSPPPPCASPGLGGLACPRRPAALGAVACTRIAAAAARRAAERAALGPEACAALDAALVALVCGDCGDGSAVVERSGGSASGGGGRGAFALVGNCVIDGTELCRLLLRGADPNTRIAAIPSTGHDHGRRGKLLQMTTSGTPLHCASGDGNLAAVRMLLAAGAAANAKDGAPLAETGEGEEGRQQQQQQQQQQRTPLEYATDEQVARALIDYGGVEATQLDE